MKRAGNSSGNPSPLLLRLWQRIVNRWRRRIGWERVGTGELPDLISKYITRQPSQPPQERREER